MIDSERIFNTITSANFPALAVEQGSELVDSWISECFAEDQKRYKTLLIEAGFFIELDPVTFVVGACDRVMKDSEGVLIEESKSTSKSKTWTAERWYESLVRGHQIPTYAAALKYGTFVEGEWAPRVAVPRILVRAATKSRPPEIWPSPEGQIVEPENSRIDAVLNMYRNEAVGIRAKRRTGLVPWAVPGKHCEKTYGFKTYMCEFAEECGALRFPVAVPSFAGFSPGSSEVVEYLVRVGKISLDNAAEVVILSSSSMEDAMQCSEKWRRRSVGQERESKESLEIGSVLHLGLKSYHEQLKESGY